MVRLAVPTLSAVLMCALALWPTIALTAGSGSLPTTMRQGPFVFPAHVRAAYQMCILNDISVDFFQLQSASRDGQGSSLRRSAEVLQELGFRVKTKRLRLQDLQEYGGAAVILGDAGYPIVANLGLEHQLIDYPQPALTLDERDFSKLWPREGIVVTRRPRPPTDGGGIVVQPCVADFGVLNQGEVFRSTFHIKNIVSHDVTVTGFETACGCTLVEGDTGPLSSGDTRAITIQFNSDGKVGYEQYKVLIKTDEGGALFKLSGYVIPSNCYYPRQIDFGTVCRSDDPKTTIVHFLGATSPERSALLDAKAHDPLSCDIRRRLSTEHGSPEDTLLVTLNPREADIGRLTREVVVTYRYSDTTRVVNVPVAATIIDSKVRWLTFAVRNVSAGEKWTRQFTIDDLDSAYVQDIRVRPEDALDAHVQSAEDGSSILVVTGFMNEPSVTEAVVEFIDTACAVRTSYIVYLTIQAKGKTP